MVLLFLHFFQPISHILLQFCGIFVAGWRWDVGMVLRYAYLTRLGLRNFLESWCLTMKRKMIAVLLSLGLLAGIVCGCGAFSLSEPAEKLGKLEHFSAQTLDGGTFTEKDLAAKDLTLINFWTTQCGPCIAEMPHLAEFAKKLPENVQVVTVCLFGENEVDAARKILDEAGFEGTTLLAGDGDYKALCDAVQATPTTLFADANGKLVGKTIVGEPDDLEKTLLAAINKELKHAGKEEIALSE